MKCSFCNKNNATTTCSACELVVYCGEACANSDWVQIHAREHGSKEEEEHAADEIIPRLWVGGLEALHDKRVMLKIQAVVSAVPNRRFKKEQIKALLGKEKALFRVPIEDAEDAPIEKFFEKAAAFIDEHLSEGHGVLVHCVAGHSRSVSLILYYLMKYKGYTLRKAFRLIKKKRPTVKVNDGFLEKLREAYQKINGA